MKAKLLSMRDGNWTTARHMEILPSSKAGGVLSTGEEEFIRRISCNEIRLYELIAKVQGSNASGSSSGSSGASKARKHCKQGGRGDVGLVPPRHSRLEEPTVTELLTTIEGDLNDKGEEMVLGQSGLTPLNPRKKPPKMSWKDFIKQLKDQMKSGMPSSITWM